MVTLTKEEKMFYTHEDIQPAVELAQRVLGKQNTYLPTANNSLHGISVATREYGKLWHGDLYYGDKLFHQLESLSATLNQVVYLIHSFSFDDPYYVTKTRIQVMSE